LIKTEEDIIGLVKEDPWMMDILRAAQSLYLPDWWICAGFVRSKVWDVLHYFYERSSLQDIDFIYFDRKNIDEKQEKKYEEKLNILIPNIPWSVKNEARMHVVSQMPPYSSSIDAISKFPETATALGLKLDENNNVLLTAPYGINDLVNLEIKPTPYFTETYERAAIYEERLIKKNWKSIWYKVKVNHIHD
jgi:uncharacterized protein